MRSRLADASVSLLGTSISLLQQPPGLRRSQTGAIVWGVLSAASIAASAYHGAKRHGGSIGWGLAWGALGGLFPVVTPAIGAAQGFAKCEFGCAPKGVKGPIAVWGR